MIDTVVMWPQFVSLGGFAFTAADLPQFLLQNSYDFSVSVGELELNGNYLWLWLVMVIS